MDAVVCKRTPSLSCCMIYSFDLSARASLAVTDFSSCHRCCKRTSPLVTPLHVSDFSSCHRCCQRTSPPVYRTARVFDSLFVCAMVCGWYVCSQPLRYLATTNGMTSVVKVLIAVGEPSLNLSHFAAQLCSSSYKSVSYTLSAKMASGVNTRHVARGVSRGMSHAGLSRAGRCGARSDRQPWHDPPAECVLQWSGW
jgi:hypothetical protein